MKIRFNFGWKLKISDEIFWIYVFLNPWHKTYLIIPNHLEWCLISMFLFSKIIIGESIHILELQNFIVESECTFTKKVITNLFL
jgi:hypothetical protein